MNKNVIYTAIIGNYDNLHDPVIVTEGWDYICFTDNKNMKSDIWQIKHIEKDTELSDRKNARKYKILYHLFVGEYNNTIYVPGLNVIKVDLNDVISLLKPEYDMVALGHPRRKCIYDEAKYIIKITNDPTGMIKKQIEQYDNDGMPKKIGLFACGLLIRRGNQKNVIKFCKLWWNEILKYSPRDQISFTYLSWKYKLIKIRKLGFRFFNTHFEDKRHNHIGTKDKIQRNATI